MENVAPANPDPNAIVNELFQRIQQLELQQIQAQAAGAARNKPEKPDQFFGTDDAKRVRQWIFQVENYFDVVGEPEARRVPYTTTLLRKNALLWWQSLQADERPAAFQDFKRVLIEYFQPLSATLVARDNLARLYQKSSVKSYIEEFKTQVLNIPDITDAEKLDKFRRGLKREVRLHVAFANPPTFDQAVSIAEQIDEVLYSHRGYNPRVYTPNSRGTSSGLAPMDIGAIQAGRTSAGASTSSGSSPYKRLSPEEKAELNRTNGCYYCRQVGHRALECPLKRQQKTR